MDNNKLVNNIKTLCAERGISISQLEKMLSLSPGLISRWAKTTPSLDRLIDIADFFNVTIDGILGETVSQEHFPKSSQLINTLFQETQANVLEWHVTDISAFPFNNGRALRSIISGDDYMNQIFYYALFERGCFLLHATYNESGNSLFLYALPDSSSKPQLICRSNTQLLNLYNLVSAILANDLNSLKTNHFIESFLENFEDDSLKTGTLNTSKTIPFR